MVGNGHEADAMTHNFKQYWEDNAALRNSVLVYNTGRSLGQFTSLYQEKAGALALPNVLITAVGTKVHLLLDPLCSPMHSSLLFPMHSSLLFPMHSSPLFPMHSSLLFPIHSSLLFPMHSSLLCFCPQLPSSSAGHSVYTTAPAPVVQNVLACTCLSFGLCCTS